MAVVMQISADICLFTQPQLRMLRAFVWRLKEWNGYYCKSLVFGAKNRVFWTHLRSYTMR